MESNALEQFFKNNSLRAKTPFKCWIWNFGKGVNAIDWMAPTQASDIGEFKFYTYFLWQNAANKWQLYTFVRQPPLKTL